MSPARATIYETVPAGAKLWSERAPDECCFVVGGEGRWSLVCADPCSGAYCKPHRAILDAAWLRANQQPQKAHGVLRQAFPSIPVGLLHPYPAGRGA